MGDSYKVTAPKKTVTLPHQDNQKIPKTDWSTK